MTKSWTKTKLPSGLGRYVLAGWLIASGLLPLLHIGGPTVAAVLNIAAIAAGALILLNR